MLSAYTHTRLQGVQNDSALFFKAWSSKTNLYYGTKGLVHKQKMIQFGLNIFSFFEFWTREPEGSNSEVWISSFTIFTVEIFKIQSTLE